MELHKIQMFACSCYRVISQGRDSEIMRVRVMRVRVMVGTLAQSPFRREILWSVKKKKIRVLAIVNSAAMNMWVHISFLRKVFSGLLGHMVILCIVY